MTGAVAVGAFALVVALFVALFVVFVAVGAAAGLLSGFALYVLAIAVMPETRSVDSFYFLRYSVDVGYLAGSLLGLIHAASIFRLKWKGRMLELERRCKIIFAFSASASVIALCAVYPGVISALASFIVVAALAWALANAKTRGRARKGKPALTDSRHAASGTQLLDPVASVRPRMTRWDWLGIGIASCYFVGMLASPDRPTLFESERDMPSFASVTRKSNWSARSRSNAPRSESANTAQSAAIAEPVNNRYIVSTRDNVVGRVRACASTACAVIGRAMPGDRITASWSEHGETIGGSSQWIAFDRGDSFGYIHSSLLELSG